MNFKKQLSHDVHATSAETASVNEFEYQKIEVDNAICNRRFHIAFEQGQAKVAHTEINCPHCGVKLWEAHNHVPALLLREENLVKNPDGTNPMVYECKFL